MVKALWRLRRSLVEELRFAQRAREPNAKAMSRRHRLRGLRFRAPPIRAGPPLPARRFAAEEAGLCHSLRVPANSSLELTGGERRQASVQGRIIGGAPLRRLDIVPCARVIRKKNIDRAILRATLGMQPFAKKGKILTQFRGCGAPPRPQHAITVGVRRPAGSVRCKTPPLPAAFAENSRVRWADASMAPRSSATMRSNKIMPSGRAALWQLTTRDGPPPNQARPAPPQCLDQATAAPSFSFPAPSDASSGLSPASDALHRHGEADAPHRLHIHII